jgi:hypothetical protein
MTPDRDAPPRIVVLSLRALVSILLAGGSVLTGYYAVDQMRKFPGSSVPAVDLSLAVMFGAMFLLMADFAVRWFWFLCSGRISVASRLWSRCITGLLFTSFAAVMVSLFFLSP